MNRDNMHIPLILMIHRVQYGSIEIPEIYTKRNMLIKLDELFRLIDNIQRRGFVIGSIQDALQKSHNFHITFDDGFREHLNVAYTIKDEFKFKQDSMTFSINTGNSLKKQFTGMDFLYQLVSNNDIIEIKNKFQLENFKSDMSMIESLKAKVLSMKPDELLQLKNNFNIDVKTLEDLYLNALEVKELSIIFNIASHGESHRDLTNYKDITSQELYDSKLDLERLINRRINTFCYPEGKNNKDIQNICKNAGYKFGLSIKHEKNNPFSIGRFCINNHRKKIMERINE